MEQLREKEIWYVLGDTPRCFFETKMLAEEWAKELFPYEDEHTRYSRIFNKRLYCYENKKEPT